MSVHMVTHSGRTPPRWTLRWSTTADASSSMPCRNVDRRRRRTGRPSAYMPGAVDHAAVVAQPALGVEHVDVEPGVVGAAAGGPEDRADLAAGQVELPARRGGHAGRARSVPGARPRRPGRSAAAQASKESSSRSSLRSARAKTFFSPPENRALPSRTIASRPTSSTPSPERALRSSVVRAAVPTSCGRRAAGGPGRGRRRSRSARPRPRSRPSTTGRRARGRCAASARARPTASVTGRPERTSSAASCTPDADAPTTRTPPSGSCRRVAVRERGDLVDRRRDARAAARARPGG